MYHNRDFFTYLWIVGTKAGSRFIYWKANLMFVRRVWAQKK